MPTPDKIVKTRRNNCKLAMKTLVTFKTLKYNKRNSENDNLVKN